MLLFLLLFILTAGLIGAGYLYCRYGKDFRRMYGRASEIVRESSAETFRASQNSVCYYSDGTVMQVLASAQNSYYLPFSAIPDDAVNAVLAVEDRKFYSHRGYDIYAIARAAKAYITNRGEIRQGGSTITQQLARTMFLSPEKTVERKVTEIFIAAGLEKKYSKKQILEFYLNNIYFANGYYGLQTAAKGYFGREAGELSLSETAFLCGIPNSPSAYNPTVHFADALERRDSVLKQMFENGFISSEAYDEARSEEIVLVKTSGSRNNYEETYTYHCAIRELMYREGFAFCDYFDSEKDRELYEEHYEEEYSAVRKRLYEGGYRIYTSINREKQALLQEAIDGELADFTGTGDEGIYSLQASGACIDNDTGFVVAICGGRAQEYNGYTLNRAYQSPRQPGSSIKPLIVYTPLFALGYYPDTTVTDERFEGGPRNSEGVYSGEIDVRYAVAVSKNTVAWKLFGELGAEAGLSYLKKMGFSSIVDTDYVPAASIGGLTYGATAVEMTSAYAAIENDGIFRTPTCIERITDASGNIIADNTLGMGMQDRYRVYDKNASRMMTDVLKTVMESGTGRRIKPDGIICAGKTGTTTDQKDGWFVGYSNYYTTGIWVGYDLPKTMEDLRGNTYPGYIWKSFMSSIHEGLAPVDFPAYNDPRPKPVITEDEEDEDDGQDEEQEDGTVEENEEEDTDGPDGETTDAEDTDPDADSDEYGENPGEEQAESDSEDPAEDESADDTSDDGAFRDDGEDDGIIWLDPREDSFGAGDDSSPDPESSSLNDDSENEGENGGGIPQPDADE